MKKRSYIFPVLILLAALVFAVSLSAEAAYYTFELNTSHSGSDVSATLTCTRDGRQIWTYQSNSYNAWPEVNEFSLILNNAGGYLRENGVYLSEHGNIKRLNMDTGEVLWSNSDFGGGTAPTDGCYTFSSSGKLYISGHYGPDLFVVDEDGSTICRVRNLPLAGSQYWPEKMWFGSGDDLHIQYESDGSTATFDVKDYFGRIDGMSHVPGMDLAPFFNSTAGEIQDTFGIEHKLGVHGMMTFDSGRNDMCIWCEYDLVDGWRSSPVVQIDLYGNSEGKYRIGDVRIGLIKSDINYYLSEAGYKLVSTEYQPDGSYDTRYVNKDSRTVYNVTYGATSYAKKVIFRGAYQADLELYDRQ